MSKRQVYGCQDGAGGPAPESFLVMVDAFDARPNYLINKLVATPENGFETSIYTNDANPPSLLLSLDQTPSLTPESDAGNFTGSMSISLANSIYRRLTLTGNTTLTIADMAASRAQIAQLMIVQGAGGSKTLSLVGCKTPGGVLFLSTNAGAIDVLKIYSDGQGNQYAWLKATSLAP